MSTFLKLIRWQNILTVALTMFAMRYAIIMPVNNYYKIEPGLEKWGFMFLVAGVMFLMAAGNVINDYFDRKTDMINRPQKVLVGFKIRRRQVMLMHIFFNFFGVVCGFVAAWFANNLWIGFFFLFISVLLWTYSSELKKILFVGNFSLALLTAIVPMAVAITEYVAYENSLVHWDNSSVHAVKIWFQTIIGFSVFSFLFNYLRELIKDCIEYKGDLETGIKSFPTVIGRRKTDFIIAGISLVSIMLVMFIWHAYLSKLMFFEHDSFSLLYIYSMIIFPGLLIFLIAFLSKKSSKYKTLSRLSKFILVTGLLYSIIFSFAIYGKI